MRKHFILFLLLVAALFTQAQDGTPDPTFNTIDRGFGIGDGAGGDVYTSAVQSDGKILIGGFFILYNTQEIKKLARLNPDGTPDPTFNPGGMGVNGSSVRSIKILPNGKIMVAGEVGSYNNKPVNSLFRLNSDGTLDTTFKSGFAVSQPVWDMAVQADGKIVIVGAFHTYGNTTLRQVARLNENGSPDLGFNPGLGPDAGSASRVAVQSDGKIIVGGDFQMFAGQDKKYLVRLNTDGTLDVGFNSGQGPSDFVEAIKVQGDGKILIGGKFAFYNGTPRNRIARLNSDGTADAGFVPAYTGEYPIVLRAIELQGDGKVLYGGDVSRVTRLFTDGSLDTTFSHPSIVGSSNIPGAIKTISVQPNGQVIIGGYFDYNGDSLRQNIDRLNADGKRDHAFNPNTGANDMVKTVQVQGDGKIIVGGWFLSFNGKPVRGLTRLMPDGSLDNTYGLPGYGLNMNWPDVKVNASVLQADGKLVVGGDFVNFGGIGRRGIARLNTNGLLDLGFNPGTGVSGVVEALALQNDGKIVVGGYFSAYNGVFSKMLVRTNTDGSLDTTFKSYFEHSSDNSEVTTISLQPDGKMILAGNFSTYAGASRRHIVRVNANGTLDTSFHVGNGPSDPVYCSALQPDGKILIGGHFGAYNGVLRRCIARLNTDGSLDTTFNTGNSIDFFVNHIVVLSDGKILVSAWIRSVGGTGNHLARLNPDGSIDPAFIIGNTNSYTINHLALQPDGKILVTGTFTSLNGIGRNRIARLNASAPNTLGIGAIATSYCAGATLSVPFQSTGTFDQGNVFTVQLSDASGSFASPQNIGSASGLSSGSINATIPFSTTPGTGYRIRIVSSSPAMTSADNGTNIAINAVPSVNAVSNQTVCTGSGTAAISFSGTPGAVYNWTNSNPSIGLAASGSGNIASFTTQNNGGGIQTATITVTPVAGSCNGQPVSFTITVTSVITTQPQPQTVCSGSAASFSVTASGTGATYQWKKDGADINGATSSTYSIASATAANAGQYSVAVTGSCGTVTSTTVALVVKTPPAISTQPVSKTACAGAQATFSVTATGGALTYQWRKDGANISGATGSSYTITPVLSASAGSYDVVIANGCGSPLTSAAATLTVNTPVANQSTWTGALNNEWGNSFNWCGDVPNANTDAVIPAGTPFSPVFSTAGSVRHLTVNAGATLTLSGGLLHLYGNLVNNGNVSAPTGALAFRGASVQSIPVLTLAFATLNGAGGVQLGGTLTITAGLTMNEGHIFLGNHNLVLNGTATGSATSHIVTDGTGVVTRTNIGTGSFGFHVGANPSSYNPVVLTGGSGRDFSVRVSNTILPLIESPLRGVNRTWTITPSSVSSNPVTVRLQYADTEGNAFFNGALAMDAGVHNGSTWSVATPAGGVNASGTATARTVQFSSSGFGPTVIANTGAVLTVTALPNPDADIEAVTMIPNVVTNEATVKLVSKRSKWIDWVVTDAQGRAVMKFRKQAPAGQSSFQLNSSHLSGGVYQLTGYTADGKTTMVRFVKQ
jgi:uncharacterized delta-60 repeat protein